MRYRPIGKSGMSISALCLKLQGERCGGDPDAWLGLIHGAFENGVNAFEISNPSPALLEGLAHAVRSVERRLVFISLRLPDDIRSDDVMREIDHVLISSGLEHLDLAVLNADRDVANEVIWTLEDLKAASKVRRLGILAETEEANQHVHSGAFDVLMTPFNLLSGWRERLRVRTATEKSMSVIATKHFPEDARAMAEPKTMKRRWFSKPAYPLAGLGSYNFLHGTHGWGAEEICLGFALTETAIASIAIDAENLKHLAVLAEVTERDLPSAVAAQIEMARFSAERAAGTERRSA